MWEVIHNETGGTWPSKSLTRTLISKSQVLTDMFIFLTPEQISEFARDCKFVQANFDAVIDEAHANGWRRVSAIRKAIQKAQKKAEEPAEEATEEAEEATDEAEEAIKKMIDEECIIRGFVLLSMKADLLGLDPVACFRKAQAEIADPDPLEIPEAFRR